MLVILMDSQLINPHQVCQACFFATTQGQPRWHQGHLGCGHAIHCATLSSRSAEDQPSEQYECAMGFRLAPIPSAS